MKDLTKYKYRKPAQGKELVSVFQTPSGQWLSERADKVVLKHDNDGKSIQGQRFDNGYDLIEPEPETEEQLARRTLPEGWLWFGRGPLIYTNDPKRRDNLMGFEREWSTGYWGNLDECFYALRAVSKIARLNGLEADKTKSKLREAVESIRWIASSEGDDRTMISTLESIQSRSITALKEYAQSVVINETPVDEQQTDLSSKCERQAKPLPPVRPDDVPYEGDEWIYAGVGPLHKTENKSADIKRCCDEEWQENMSGYLKFPYALRRGSEIHRAQTWFDESQVNVSPKQEKSDTSAEHVLLRDMSEWREMGPEEPPQTGDQWLNGGSWQNCVSGLGKPGFYAQARTRRPLPVSLANPTLYTMVHFIYEKLKNQ